MRSSREARRGGRILEIGCGEGYALREFKERFEIHRNGIEKSVKAAKWVASRYSNAEIAKGDADFGIPRMNF
ncbi:MAG: class I SAM-dependent methyltransferase [Clostridiales Family XIII bacterium]|nr:class I SAM-dependent methyltransferase [Clostridiales Family XIII bacterium]